MSVEVLTMPTHALSPSPPPPDSSSHTCHASTPPPSTHHTRTPSRTPSPPPFTRHRSTPLPRTTSPSPLTSPSPSPFTTHAHYSKLWAVKLPTSSTALTSDIGPFRQETGEDEESCYLLQHALLENPESETRWYFKYFLGKVHYNYLCYDNSKSPLFLSVMRSESAASTYRCILWKKTGNKRLYIEPGAGGKVPSPRYILEKFSGSKYERSIKELSIASIQKDLLTLEEQEGSVNFKFGVLYAKAGQKTDNEMFSNENGSERFQKFVELLGEEVGLEGWPQFKGGLDNKNNSTGKTSVYTVFEGHEIMFHVSTLLPYSTGNEQQVISQ